MSGRTAWAAASTCCGTNCSALRLAASTSACIIAGLREAPANQRGALFELPFPDEDLAEAAHAIELQAQRTQSLGASALDGEPLGRHRRENGVHALLQR